MNKGIVAAVVVVIAGLALAFWLYETTAPKPAPTSSVAEQTPEKPPQAKPPEAPEAPARANNPPAQPIPPKPKPKGFCKRDFDNVDAREADVPDLKAAGGLVYIFEREARLADPYGCADLYLARGLDVNAVDPRPDHGRLTGLHFAIKRNDPKMVHFMIDHGADLKKRAGEKDLKPMGYAYNLAFNDTRIDRNKVIGILDAALTKKAQSGDAATGGDR